MNQSYLLLWLEGPLQSWGYDSKFGRRDTLDFPSKSGVLGLIACARGVGDEQTEWLNQFSGDDMQIIAYSRTDRSGNRCINPPLLRDFQMVGSGYDDQNPWQSLLIPKTSDGKKAVGGGTKMTYRYYLQNSAFAVAIQGPSGLITDAAHALADPVWDLYLGRKNCVPSEFIGQGIYESADDAFAFSDEFAHRKSLTRHFRVRQGSHEGDILTLNDVPLQFGIHKKYKDRQVTIQKES